jgi:hypothetical protein
MLNQGKGGGGGGGGRVGGGEDEDGLDGVDDRAVAARRNKAVSTAASRSETAPVVDLQDIKIAVSRTVARVPARVVKHVLLKCGALASTELMSDLSKPDLIGKVMASPIATRYHRLFPPACHSPATEKIDGLRIIICFRQPLVYST